MVYQGISVPEKSWVIWFQRVKLDCLADIPWAPWPKRRQDNLFHTLESENPTFSHDCASQESLVSFQCLPWSQNALKKTKALSVRNNSHSEASAHFHSLRWRAVDDAPEQRSPPDLHLHQWLSDEGSRSLAERLIFNPSSNWLVFGKCW